MPSGVKTPLFQADINEHGVCFQGKLLLEQNKLELASFHVRFVFHIHRRVIYARTF